MAPTMEVDSAVCPSSVRIECGSLKPVCARKAAAEDVLDMLETLQDLDNTCETYFSGRTAIPEASAAFKETLDKMKLEQDQGFCKRSKAGHDGHVSPQPQASSTPSLLSKLKSAFKPSSPRRSEGLPSLSSATSKTSSSSRRPASFGGSDVVKPGSCRRASQSEKRVSWADERGPNQPLFSVRFIKPRLNTDTAPAGHRTPGHSILRNPGVM